MGRLFELRRPWRAAMGFCLVAASGLLSYSVVLNPQAPAAALIVGSAAWLIHVAVVNRAFLQRYGDAMFGQSVKVNEYPGISIVGTVPELQYHDLRAAAQPLIYLVDDQFPSGSSRQTCLVRVAPGNERQVVGQLRQQLRQRFPDLVIPWIEPMRDHIARQTMPHRQRPGANETLPSGAQGQPFD